MPTLLEDFEAIVGCAEPFPTSAGPAARLQSTNAHVERCARVRAFIKAHQPWLPPKMDGFGEWIEYDGTNGPRIDEKVRVLTRLQREDKATPFFQEARPARTYDWSQVVAFCRPEKVDE